MKFLAIPDNEMQRSIFSFLLFSWLFLLTAAFPCAHPFKASVSEINYNAETGSLEITLKLFTDDLEGCITVRTGELLYLDTGNELPSAVRSINDYVQSGMRIMLNGKPVTLEFLGKEQEPGVTWCYLESGEVTYPSELTVYNSIMTELYPTQSNIVHIQVEKQRKSLLLGTARPSGTVVF